MNDTGKDVVTGAFSYTGKYITKALLDSGGRFALSRATRIARIHSGARSRPFPTGSTTRARWQNRWKVRRRSTTPTGFASTVAP
jgi:hypothetical protein